MATIKTLLGNVKGKDGGGYEEVVLYDGNCSACINSNIITSSSAMMELSDSIENYKSIRIEYLTYDGRGEGAGLIYNLPIVVSVDYIKTTYGYNAITTGATGSNGSNFSFGFYNDKHLAQTWATHGSLAHNMSHIKVIGIRDKVPDAEKNFNKYSTTEEVVGTWIDGKPLYRKVVQTIISDGGIVLSDANCILVRYEWYAPTKSIKLLKLPSPNTGNAALWQLNNGNIVFNIPSSSEINGKLATCILEYTKTTD